MLTKTESGILLGAIKHARMEDSFLKDTSADIIKKDSDELYLWKDLYSNDFPLSEDVYEDFLLKNSKPISFLPFTEDVQVKFFQEKDFTMLADSEQDRWSIFYSLSRPGISIDEKNALIQITAYCPAGPPNYGSIYLLEKTESDWVVKFNFGLYNQ